MKELCFSVIFSYKTSNGIERSETGTYEKLNGSRVLKVEGYFRYTGDDGKVYLVEYTADENGYIPEISELSDEDDDGRLNGAVLGSLVGGNLGWKM